MLAHSGHPEMSAESQSPAAQRGKVLIEQRRYADAERYFRACAGE